MLLMCVEEQINDDEIFLYEENMLHNESTISSLVVKLEIRESQDLELRTSGERLKGRTFINLKNLSYFKKQNKPAITKKKTKQKEKKMRKEKQGLPIIELRTFNAQGHSVITSPTHYESSENILLKPFPLVLRQRDLCQVDRALLNMNSKTFFRTMTVVLTVNTQRKRISSNLKNGSPSEPIRHEFVC